MKLNKEQRKTLQELLILSGLSELERLRIINKLYEIELEEMEPKNVISAFGYDWRIITDEFRNR